MLRRTRGGEGGVYVFDVEIAWMFLGPKKAQLLVALAFIAEDVKGLFLRFSVHLNQCCCGSLQDFLSY